MTIQTGEKTFTAAVCVVILFCCISAWPMATWLTTRESLPPLSTSSPCLTSWMWVLGRLQTVNLWRIFNNKVLCYNLSLKRVWLIMTSWRRQPASSDPNSSSQEPAPTLALSTTLAWRRSDLIVYLSTKIFVVTYQVFEKRFVTVSVCVSAVWGAERLPAGWHGSYQRSGGSWRRSYSL